MPTSQEAAPTIATLRPVTVITGGSEGIGLALARQFASAGDDLLLIARSEERLIAAAQDLRKTFGRRVQILALDITRSDAPSTIDAALTRDGSYPRTIVNNAGMGLTGAFACMEAAEIEGILQLNIMALTRIMRHFAPGMQERREGGFLNIASIGGYVPGPYQAVYYASKSYVISLSEALATELRPSGVRVTVVAPGAVSTRFHARARAEKSLYRWIVPSLPAEYIAWWAVRGFSVGLVLVLPGLLSLASFAALRLLPHRLVIPLIGALLKPRGREADDA